MQEFYNKTKADRISSGCLTLKECLLLLTDIISEAPVRIIIDALDEADDWRKLLGALKTISTKAGGAKRIKILVSGRPDVEASAYFADCLKIELNSTLSMYDLQEFVLQEVKNREDHERILGGHHPELEDELIDVLLESAGGM